MLDPLHFLQMSRLYSMFNTPAAAAAIAEVEMEEMGVAAVPAAPASQRSARSERSATSRTARTAPADTKEVVVVVSTTRCVGTTLAATVRQRKSMKAPEKSVRAAKRVIGKNVGVKRKAGVKNIKACHQRGKEYARDSVTGAFCLSCTIAVLPTLQPLHLWCPIVLGRWTRAVYRTR
jgi:hypothetical protein